MRDLAKAQLTIGFLAYFATIWEFALLREFPDLITAASPTQRVGICIARYFNVG